MLAAISAINASGPAVFNATLFCYYFTIIPLHCPWKIILATNPHLPSIIHNSPFPANTSTGVNSALRFKGEKNMKATGIVRRVDDLGRIVIPKEIRRTLRIREGDPLQTSLTRWEVFCFSMLDLAKRRGW
jgi:AbrB family looped-hinge helix DNA binding protein